MANNDVTLFQELWFVIRDYYAPNMTRTEAIKKAVDSMNALGHEAFILTKHMFLVDNSLFEIKKVPGYVHFELFQRCVRI